MDFISAVLQKDLAGMHTLCMIVLNSGQGMVLPQEDRIPGGLVALLREKTTVFSIRMIRILRPRRPVPYISLTPSHYPLRRLWCQARAHWRMERRYVVFSNEIRFCLGTSDGRELFRRRPGERLQPNCLRSRHTGPTPGVIPARSPDLSPIEPAGDIIGQQLQHHPYPALTVPVFTQDLELEVNEDDIEELIMGHEDELTIEELQEILNEEHQETQ
ncbi:transposable element Tc1 transposase [Trichonephila clavipes]|nr:transposable element Tc1 transposase [Trichonephila clavipes]